MDSSQGAADGETPGGAVSATEVDAELAARVRQVIAGYLDIDAATLGPETSLADLGADSLDFIEIMFELEEKFGVEAEAEISELRARILDVGDVIELVAGLVAEKAAAGKVTE